MFVIAVKNSPKCFKIGLIQYIYFCLGFEAFKTKLQLFQSSFCPSVSRRDGYKENTSNYQRLSWKPCGHFRILNKAFILFVIPTCSKLHSSVFLLSPLCHSRGGGRERGEKIPGSVSVLNCPLVEKYCQVNMISSWFLIVVVCFFRYKWREFSETVWTCTDPIRLPVSLFFFSRFHSLFQALGFWERKKGEGEDRWGPYN